MKLTATMLRHVVHSLRAANGRRATKSRHCSSTTKYSYSGPVKSTAVSRRDFAVSTRPTGQYPRACRASAGVAWPCEVKIRKVMTVQTTQVNETDAIRARITDGASRDKVGDGLVVGDR